jgi:hypothetical protein
MCAGHDGIVLQDASMLEKIEPSVGKITVFLRKRRPIRPFFLQDWAIFVHPAQSIHTL